MQHRVRLGWLAAGSLALLASGPAMAGFAGTDVFLPSVGARPGVAPSVWYTTVWVHNPGVLAANVTFHLLERDQANPAPLTYTDSVGPKDTKRYDDAVQLMFAKQVFGALRVTSTQKVVVSSRIYSQAGAGLDDSVGQFFAGVPASFAVGAGQSTQIVGAWQTQPAAGSVFRGNFGFVEATGSGACQVKVTVLDPTGAAVASKSYAVRAWEQVQKAVKDEFPGVSLDNARLAVEVESGSGRVVAFGSSVANGSQDPSTLEMSFRDELLAENASGGTITGVTAGRGLTGGGSTGIVTLDVGAGAGIAVDASGVSVATGGITTGMLADGAVTGPKLADGAVGTAELASGAVTGHKLAAGAVGTAELASGAVTKAKLSAAGGVAGQVLGTNGDALVWQTPSAASGDITGVTAGSGLTGGGTSGDVTLALKVPIWLTSGGTSEVIHGESTGTGFGVTGYTKGGRGVQGTDTGTGNFAYLGAPQAAAVAVASAGDAVFARATASNGCGINVANNASGLDRPGILAAANHSSGIAVHAMAETTVTALAATNTGTGDIIRAYSSGSDLEFRVKTNGNVTADGSFTGGGADFAELLPAAETLGPGEVAAVAADGRLVRSTVAYQQSLLGVVSTRPGFVGDLWTEVPEAEKVPLAVVGVVSVRVCDEGGPVRPGDQLTSSSRPGVAMRAVRFVPGAILGKALSALEEGEGVVHALVMPR